MADRVVSVRNSDDNGEVNLIHGKFERASLGPGTHTNNIAFNNTTNSQGNTTRVATLVVNPKDYRLAVSASPTADGTVTGAGTFAEGSSVTVTATPSGSHSFVNWTQNAKVVSTSASYAFTMPSANATLTAHFK